MFNTDTKFEKYIIVQWNYTPTHFRGDKMKTLNLAAIVLIGMMLTSAFAGCIGGEKDSTGGNGSIDENSAVDNSNATANASVPIILDFYMTAKVIEEFDGGISGTIPVPIPYGAVYELTALKPAGADESAAAAMSTLEEAYEAIWEIKLNETIKIKTVTLHFWMSYDIPDAQLGMFYSCYKNDESISQTVGLTPGAVSPGVVEYTFELQPNKKYAAGDVFGIGVGFFGTNVYQSPTVHFLCGAEHPSCATVSGTLV